MNKSPDQEPSRPPDNTVIHQTEPVHPKRSRKSIDLKELEILRRSLAESAAGEVVDAFEALDEISRKYGLDD